jgi:hypothetical protein
MKVSSPVGEYPYEVKSVALRRGRVVVTGSLGVWETTMEIEPADWLELGRRAARPAAALGAAGLLLLAGKRLTAKASF